MFWQIHRATIVNVQAIVGVSRDFRGRQLVQVKGHTSKLEVKSQLHASLQTDVAAWICLTSGELLRETRGLFGVRQGFLLF